MNRREADMLELRLKLLYVCFKKDLKVLEGILDRLYGKNEGAPDENDFLGGLKSKLFTICVDIKTFQVIMDMELKGALNHLKELCDEDLETDIEVCPMMNLWKELCENEETCSIFPDFGV